MKTTNDRTAGDTPGPDLHGWLAAQFDLLGRWLAGRYLVQISDEDPAVAAEHLFDADFLRQQLLEIACNATPSEKHDTAPSADGSNNQTNRALTIGASKLIRHYSMPVTTVALVGLTAGLAFDLSPRQCRMTYAHGMPYRLMLGDPAAQPTVLAALAGFDAPAHVSRVEAVEELRAIAWQSLYGDNLAPLFAALASVTRIAPSLMWTNAAESVATLHESAEEYLDLDLAAPVIAECDTVFAAESLPGIDDRTNPLRGRLERPLVTVDGQEYRVETRKMCCLCYLLEDRSGRLCQNCPYLSAEDRVRLVRERHGLPIGSPGGPAEKQAIARGRQRPSIGVVLRSR